MSRPLLFASGPAAALVVWLLPLPGLEGPARGALSVTVWMATWWITEAVPISITALLPLALFPLGGILSARETSAAYGSEAIFLFLGGMLLAQAMERSRLHRRIALTVIRFTGSSGRSLILGFMVATAVVSMWVSNTASTVMVLPVALATLKTLIPEQNAEASPQQVVQQRHRFAKALLLGIAYAASIGGMGTLVGSPPNLVFAGMIDQLFPQAPPISFFDWMKIGIPMVVIFLPIAWLILTRVVWRWDERALDLERSHIDREIRALGPLRRAEALTLTVFFTTAFLWIFRADLRLGLFTIPGWSRLFGEPAFLRDSTVAIAAAVALFLLPVNLRKGEFLLGGDWYRHVPWNVLILLGGGFALAAGFQGSGLSEWLGNRLGGLAGIPILLMIFVLALGVTHFTEVASNTATATVLLPILAASAVALGINPYALMLPAALAASCAFMLPAATPPNAIIFSSGHLRVRDMVMSGIIINLVGAILIALLTYALLPLAFGVDLGRFPAWAR
jgi:sodium-dependent dicarboxylate transporter 2/3/5